MILNAAAGEALPIYGDGRQVRDWIHVDDHCAGVVAAIRAGRPGESYNLGGECEKTNLEVVDAICAALERVRPAAANPHLASRGIRSYADLKTFVADRAGHDRRYAIDPSKASRELGWSARQRFADGARRDGALVPRPPRTGARPCSARPDTIASGWGSPEGTR